MSQTTTLIMLPQTAYHNPGNGAPYTVVGDPQPAASYYLGNKDLQTVNINLTNCTGNVFIQASLNNPITVGDDTQWFNVYELDANANSSSSSDPFANSNASVYTNIVGNFVYLRAVVQDFQGGVVNFVKLSY
jgi:hypothetical protein